MNKWILTDDSTGQHVRKSYPESGIFDVIDTVARGNEHYSAVIATVIFDPATGYDAHSPDFASSFLCPYGYESYEDLQKQYGESALQIAAECVFETEISLSAPSVFDGTLDECIDFIDSYVQKEHFTHIPQRGVIPE